MKNQSFKAISTFIAVCALGAAPLAMAAPVTFFGEDIGAGEATRLAATPNANAARAAFLSNLTGVGTETFESYSPGNATGLGITFPGAGTATLGGGDIVNVPTGTNGFGRYPISGDQFLETASNLTITFSTAIAAFGFYGIDIGDFNGQVTVTYVGGTTETLNIGNSVQTAGGGVLYFGFYDTANPFTSLTFGNTNAGTDFFGFDDFTIGTVEQVTPASAPATLPLVGLGLFGLLMARRRRAAA